MGAVERVAGLERDDAAPTEPGEALAQLVRRMAKRAVIVMRDRPQSVDAATHMDRMGAMQEVGHPRDERRRPCRTRRALPRPSLAARLADLHDGCEQSFGIAQRNRVAGAQTGREVLAHVEGHRDRPQHARREPHPAQNPLVLGRAHEPLERGESAVQQELEIAELTRGEVPALRVARPAPCFAELRLVDIQVPERSAIRFGEQPRSCAHHRARTAGRVGVRARRFRRGRMAPRQGVDSGRPSGAGRSAASRRP